MRADLAAAHEGGIDQFLADQPSEDILIFGEMLGLAAHGLLPLDAKPFQVAKDAGLEVGRAARRVDVFDAQQQPPAGIRSPFSH